MNCFPKINKSSPFFISFQDSFGAALKELKSFSEKSPLADDKILSVQRDLTKLLQKLTQLADNVSTLIN